MDITHFALEKLTRIFSKEHLLQLLLIVIILSVGFLAAKSVKKVLHKSLAKKMEKGQTILIERMAGYAIFILVFSLVLNQFGLSLSVFLGTAGILTVALGFASQTSVSNVISGLFLIAERPFNVGNIIEVDGTVGEVLSIDLLSVKLRTFDNLYVRIPNESMIKTKVVNCTRFDSRRLDAKVRVSYKEDLNKVSKILLEVADKNPQVLKDPAPRVYFQGFGESSMDIQFSLWFSRDTFYDCGHAIYREIKEAFEQAGVGIPYPHRSFVSSGGSTPIYE
jgi:small-conductance mechanosensitive channel